MFPIVQLTNPMPRHLTYIPYHCTMTVQAHVPYMTDVTMVTGYNISTDD